MFTRQEIESVEVGTLLAFSIIGRPEERKPQKVTSIFARGISDKGRAYVCGYMEFVQGARMSFSLTEGDESCARFYRIVETR